MNSSSLKDQFAKGKSSIDEFTKGDSSVEEQMAEMIVEALSSNDKVIEIRPAERTKKMGLKRLLLLGAAVIAFAYWAQNSQKSDDLIESVKEKATGQVHEAAESIEEGSEAASERIEAGSKRAGDAVQEAGDAVQEASEKAAEKTEEAGEEAADQTEEAGETAADRVDEVGDEEEDETYSSASSSSGI